jgi:hypothetical protein
MRYREKVHYVCTFILYTIATLKEGYLKAYQDVIAYEVIDLIVFREVAFIRLC